MELSRRLDETGSGAPFWPRHFFASPGTEEPGGSTDFSVLMRRAGEFGPLVETVACPLGQTLAPVRLNHAGVLPSEGGILPRGEHQPHSCHGLPPAGLAHSYLDLSRQPLKASYPPPPPQKKGGGRGACFCCSFIRERMEMSLVGCMQKD